LFKSDEVEKAQAKINGKGSRINLFSLLLYYHTSCHPRMQNT
jgi:hypothetical protein